MPSKRKGLSLARSSRLSVWSESAQPPFITSSQLNSGVWIQETAGGEGSFKEKSRVHPQVVHGTASLNLTVIWISFLTPHCLVGLFCDSRLATLWLLSLASIHRWSYCPSGCCGSPMAPWALGKRVTQPSHKVRKIYKINNVQKNSKGGTKKSFRT